MAKKISLRELAELTESEWVGDPDFQVSGVADLQNAGSHEVAFLENPRYERLHSNSRAGVILMQPSIEKRENRNYLLQETPSLAFQKVIEHFIAAPQSGFSGIHPSAVIHETVKLGDSVTVGPHAVIDRNAEIGDSTHIGAGVSIGAEVEIGSNCFLHPKVVIREACTIGKRVVLQPGAVIGSCGFGYYTDSKGVHHPLKQLGRVILEDDVEVGANTTIDRARFGVTRVQRGTKIDNLVQIAHQVDLGEHNLIVSQVGISGSTTTGRSVIMGGQVGVVGHIAITDGVILAARAGVSKPIKVPGIYSGAPAEPIKKAHEMLAQLRSMSRYIKKIKALEKKYPDLLD